MFLNFAPGGKGSLGPSVLVRGEHGLIRAQDLVVGDVLQSLDVPGIPQNFTTTGTTPEDLAALVLDPADVLSATPVLTTINDIKVATRTGAVAVNDEMFTRNHRFVIERAGVVKIVKASELVETDKMMDTATSTFIDITLEFLNDIEYLAYSINCEPYDFYLTETTLTFDNIEWYPGIGDSDVSEPPA